MRPFFAQMMTESRFAPLAAPLVVPLAAPPDPARIRTVLFE